MEDDSCDPWSVYLGTDPDEEIFVTYLTTGWVVQCAIALRASLFRLKIGSYVNCLLSAWVTQTMKIAIGYQAHSTASTMKAELSVDVLPRVLVLGKSSLDKTPGDIKTITSQKYERQLLSNRWV